MFKHGNILYGEEFRAVRTGTPYRMIPGYKNSSGSSSSSNIKSSSTSSRKRNSIRSSVIKEEIKNVKSDSITVF